IQNNVDYAALRRRPKPLIGYSDVTALHAAIATRCEVVSYHGPTARAELTPFAKASLERALHGEDSCGAAITASMLHPGRARGRLVGGNLALLSALAGTPYEPNYHDAILIVEDVNEAAYRIDRMLTQLRLAGRLAQCRGIVFGQFTDIPTAASAGSTRTLDDVLREVVCLDIREKPEVNLGRIPGAVHLARGSMETKIEALIPREKRVVIYCANGNRSAFAADTLQQMGYRDVASMAGGFRDWVALGGDVEG